MATESGSEIVTIAFILGKTWEQLTGQTASGQKNFIENPSGLSRASLQQRQNVAKAGEIGAKSERLGTARESSLVGGTSAVRFLPDGELANFWHHDQNEPED